MADNLPRTGGHSARQRIWNAVRGRQERDWTILGISLETELDIRLVKQYVRALRLGGFVERTNPTENRSIEARLRLVRDNGQEAPRLDDHGQPTQLGLGIEQMWRTMRLCGEFNYVELAAQASTEAMQIGESHAQFYTRLLHRAGYLVETQPRRKAGRCFVLARYRLLPGKYTGPRPPMKQQSKGVYDPNLNRVVWEEVQRADEY
ncbi:hypothetical protein ABWL39_20485 [Chitinivorax sp. PXF-14]|uniref:hypothetical protein n=1 Tax=Chitinivorax sp. PXF-14 TaxID=3230488 RepID=UPI0034668864